MRRSNQQKIDFSVMEVRNLSELDDAEDVAYWRRQTPTDRLLGLEALRQAMYDYDPDTARFSLVFELLDRP